MSNPPGKAVIEEKHFESGIELLRALRFTEKPWKDRILEPYHWAFRGQADARWELIPSALRIGKKLGFDARYFNHTSEGRGSCLNQSNAEFIVIKQFLEAADHVGLEVPGDHPFFRSHNASATYPIGSAIGSAEWPKTEMLELIAVAQHHGVPTRLLDFTYSPLKAVYFAAKAAKDHYKSLASDGALSFSVWGIDIGYLKKNFSGVIPIVCVPRGRNPFVKAQDGLFIFDRHASYLGPKEITPSLDSRIREQCLISERNGVQRVVRITKYTAPLQTAPETLRLLELENIDDAHLMPTFDNVVVKLRQRNNITAFLHDTLAFTDNPKSS